MSENRKRGGQPGNHNALKHGRYIARANQPIHNFTRDEQITVLDHLITVIKRQVTKTYQEGMKLTDQTEILKTMDSLSLAAIGLCRLIKMYDGMVRVPYIPIEKAMDLEENAMVSKLLKKTCREAGDSLVGLAVIRSIRSRILIKNK